MTVNGAHFVTTCERSSEAARRLVKSDDEIVVFLELNVIFVNTDDDDTV